MVGKLKCSSEITFLTGAVVLQNWEADCDQDYDLLYNSFFHVIGKLKQSES